MYDADDACQPAHTAHACSDPFSIVCKVRLTDTYTILDSCIIYMYTLIKNMRHRGAYFNILLFWTDMIEHVKIARLCCEV